MSRTDLDPATLANILRTKAGDGSIEWVSEPIQASVLLDIADMLDENVKLKQEIEAVGTAAYLYGRNDLSDENAKLREEVEQWHRLTAGIELPDYPITEFKPKDLERENAKLRELCADMYGFIKRMDEDCGDVTFSDCFDYCKHDTADDGCCKTGECWYEQRLRELGIEVDE